MKLKFHRFSGKSSLSRISIGIIIILSYLQTSNLHRWKKENGVINWDTVSYYAYLPALFIHYDLSLEFTAENPELNTNRFWPVLSPTGKKVIKTSSGLAFLYFPFFMTAHFLAAPLGFEADGFSEIYQQALAYSPLLYLLIGLLYLKKILQKYFNDKVTAITLLSTGLATNLFFYSATSTMSHTFSFCLVNMFLLISMQWLERPGYLDSLKMGLLLGLISLIRPTNSIIVLFPLLFGIGNLNSLWERIGLFLKKPVFIIIIISGIFFIWLPQFIYWKYQTGHFLYFSYTEKEQFFWSQPAILRGLFGFRKGWLIYTPIMIFSLIGIGLCFNKLKDWFYPLIVIIPLSIYIMLSWWSWWYGGGFGMRPIIDYYGLLAIPFALAISSISKLKPVFRYFSYLALLFFFYLGIFHHLQSLSGGIHWDSMTWKSYKYNFGNRHMTAGGEKYLIHPDYEKAKMKREWD